MLGNRVLVGMTVALIVAFSVPAALATDESLARTTDNGCVLVAWAPDPYVVSSATGCTGADPCVDVNWTTTPPQVGIVDC